MKAQPSTLPNVEATPEKWYVVDAEGQVVGRLAARVAKLVRGKLSTTYAPHLNPKIHVVVVNAEKALFTGNKWKEKTYYRHSGWRTGIKAETAEKTLARAPEEILRHAIHGMLPRNRLGRVLNKNVRIYAGAEHPHAAQQPQELKIRTRQPKVRL